MAAVRSARRFGSERGAEIVEFAFVVPMLLVLMAGIADFTFLFQSFEVSTNAAREGARLAVLPGYDVNGYAAARTRVADYLTAGGAQGAHLSSVAPVPVDLGDGRIASGVQVDVTYTHDFLFVGPVIGLLNGTFAPSVTYTTSVVMMSELQPPVAGP